MQNEDFWHWNWQVLHKLSCWCLSCMFQLFPPSKKTHTRDYIGRNFMLIWWFLAWQAFVGGRGKNKKRKSTEEIQNPVPILMWWASDFTTISLVHNGKTMIERRHTRRVERMWFDFIRCRVCRVYRVWGWCYECTTSRERQTSVLLLKNHRSGLATSLEKLNFCVCGFADVLGE